jgi:acyl carrier protein
MSEEGIAHELRSFIAKEFLNGKDEGLDLETPLLEWGVIDSIAIVSLTEFIKQRFGVKVPTAELKPTNLATLRAMAAMVSRLQK